MKTLVVLSALVAVALAAPALLGEGSENSKQTITSFPETFVRERKSPQELSQPPISETQENDPEAAQTTEQGVSGRTLVVKKPIIIKKKQGLHHVYRDSDKEQVESNEACGKQVKVKLCDNKSGEILRSSTTEDKKSPLIDEKVKNSIKLAKEAVENLQQNLKIAEKKPGTKDTLRKHGQSENDAELHQDIEVAREALEHLHKNFGNLDSMSLHATTLKNPDTIQDAHFQIAKTEEQRLAQWKEAIDSIHKNAEIAKNIEDSFKSASDITGFVFTEDPMSDDTNQMQRASEDMMNKNENKVNSKSCKKKHPKAELVEEDMASAASTIVEKTLRDSFDTESNSHKSGLTTAAQIDKAQEKALDNSLKEKNADMDTMHGRDFSQKDSVASDSMKMKNENKERNTKEETNHKLSLTETSSSESNASGKKLKDSEDMLLMQRLAPDNHNHEHKSLKSNEQLQETKTIDTKHLKMKFAENVDKQDTINKGEKMDREHLPTKQPKEVDTKMLVKSADEMTTNTEKEFLVHKQEHSPHKNHLEQHQHFTEAKQAPFQDLQQQTEKGPKNIAEHMQFQQHSQPLLQSEMREPSDQHMHQHLLATPSLTRWAEDEKNLQSHMELMKSADSTHSLSIDHHQTGQHPGHHHHMQHTAQTMKHHHLETPSDHLQLHSRFSDNFTPQEKSADMDMQSYYMSMRDGSHLRPENHRFRWRPVHGSAARTAYGPLPAPAPMPSNEGNVVGVFPGGKSSCAIPLLLSCNPSIVHGKLSNGHSPPSPPPYSTPAYRAEEEFNLLTKRDVKKSQDSLPNHLHRTPANVNLKTSTVLVAKQ